MELWEILVPVEDRFGDKISLPYHQLWDAKVRQIAGGLTILKSAKGNWVSPGGELFAEKMIPVRIACSKEHIEVIADLTAKHYNQLAVMYYLVSREVFIKNFPQGN